MQADELEGIKDKKVRFKLKLADGSFLTEKSTNSGEYYVYWFDARMKNYIAFIKYIEKIRLTTVKIHLVLVVDKEEYLENIEKIREEATEKSKSEIIVALKMDDSLAD